MKKKYFLSDTEGRNDKYSHLDQMDIVVVRLNSHGHRFELPCHRQKIEEYMKKGRVQPPDLTTRICVQPSVFTNCFRKELATNASLQAAFQTTSFDTIASTILQFGDVVMNEKDRQEKRHEKKELQETVIRLTRNLLVNRFTGLPPDESELRDELKSTKEARCVEQVEPLLQAAFFASIVVKRNRLDCQRVAKMKLVTYPVSQEAEWNDFLLDYDGLVAVRRKSLMEGADRVVELLLVCDAFLDSYPTERWRAVAALATSVVDAPLSASDNNFFQTYEFILPTTEQVDVDLTNRLQALEKLKQVDEDTSRSPNKSKKGKRTANDFHSDDEVENPRCVIHPSILSKYDVMTHKQLQDLCKQRKLSSGGKKQDLIERLEALDETPKLKLKA